MKELIRDTVFGHLLRILTKGKVLPYAEDRDPTLWKRYVDGSASGRMAHHGHLGEEEKDEIHDTGGDSSTIARRSSETRIGSPEAARINSASGVRVDPEKGKDVTMVTWFSDNDPEVCGASRTSTYSPVDISVGPTKLEHAKEVLGHLPDLSLDLFRLHWLRHLLCGYTRCRAGVWCQSSRCNSRAHFVRSRVWTWT